jgi:hypothetical protein
MHYFLVMVQDSNEFQEGMLAWAHSASGQTSVSECMSLKHHCISQSSPSELKEGLGMQYADKRHSIFNQCFQQAVAPGEKA